MSAVDHPDKLIADAKRFKQAIDASSKATQFSTRPGHAAPRCALYRTHKSVRSFAQMSMFVSSTYFELSSLLALASRRSAAPLSAHWSSIPGSGSGAPTARTPALAGSYMAACVLYGAITGLDPSLDRYIPNSMKAEDADLVRIVANRALAAARTAATTEVTTAGPFMGPT